MSRKLCKDDKPTITVGELIAKLGHFDLDLPVEIEGCDCVGEAFDVEESTAWDYTDPKIPEIPCVLITRTDH